MADYDSSRCGTGRRGLGMRRGNYVRASLHDPFEENALVLYTPKELSAHEQLTTDRWVWPPVEGVATSRGVVTKGVSSVVYGRVYIGLTVKLGGCGFIE